MKKSIFGILIMMESLFLGLSLLVALLYCEPCWKVFLETAAFALALGFCFKYLGEREKSDRFTRSDSYLVVALSWIIFSLIGMIPFIYIAGMDLPSAFFETMSGFTTTGATCINDIDSLPRSLLFWRAITQWIGGLGIVVFSFALIPVYEFRNSNIYSAEVTGLSLDKLRPKIGATARRMLLIYIFLTSLCAFLYWVGPMNLYDAICHAFTTIATGGFSTHTQSMAYFHSSYIEYVACVFMLASSVNFSLYYYLSIKRSNTLFKNEEFRTFFAIIAFAVVGFMLLFFFAPVPATAEGTLPVGLEETFRSALFHVSSVMTSTGFAAQKFDYVAWGPSFWMPTVVIMAIGSCAGSTAGGIKVIRVLICAKSVLKEFILQLHPRAVIGVRISGRIVPDERVHRALAFVFLYIILVVIAMLCYSLLGADVDTALGSSISMLSNVGPATGATGPASNFANVPAAGKWLMSAYMLIGRLEIFTILFLFMPSFWKERK
ncbi:MAG: TrkH family potassium uptake protein [Bacteroidaceae bacterium]|nr:TrkH family potassium uptake protein [Bacteroidaceae bacterium]